MSNGSKFNYPILFPADEMTKDVHFQSLGLGALGEATSCFVTEERNGSFELEMKYPVDGIRFKDLKVDNLIVAPTSPDTVTTQIFRIYKITKPIDSIVTVKAEHISYLLNKVTVLPFKATNCAMAMVSLQSHIVWDTEDKAFPTCPFSFYSDISDESDFELDKPSTVRSLLGSGSGSLLSAYDGEFKFDNFNVSLLKKRGHDTDVVLTYGKNISSIESTDDISEVYTGIVPYWKGTITTALHSAAKDSTDEYNYTTTGTETVSKETTVYLDPPILWTNHRKDYAYPLVVPVDLTQQDTQKDDSEKNIYITLDQRKQALRKNAMAYLSKNGGWDTKTNIKITANNLWETEEYENFTAIQRADICDTVKVSYPKLGIETKLMVTKTKYDVLLNRYDSVELGEPKSSFTASIIDTARENSASQEKKTNQFGITMQQRINRAMDEFAPVYKQAVDYATDMINGAFNKFGGALAGYVVFNRAANGSVNEILIMDTPKKSTAHYVWRWNQGGLGHSHSGYYGPFDDVAITQDGHINANMITVGTLNAGVLKAGLITSLAVAKYTNPDGSINENALKRVVYWDLVSGEFNLPALQDLSSDLDDEKKAREALAAEQAQISANIDKTISDTVSTELENTKTSLENELAGKYVDANGKVNGSNAAFYQGLLKSLESQKKALDDSMTQEKIFNVLTNNGQTMGIYMADTNSDGKSDSLYINANYIKSGTLKANYINGGFLVLGGQNGMYGTQYMLDPYQQIIGKWDWRGLRVGEGTDAHWLNQNNNSDNGWDVIDSDDEPWVRSILDKSGVSSRQVYVTNNMKNVTDNPFVWLGYQGPEFGGSCGTVAYFYGKITVASGGHQGTSDPLIYCPKLLGVNNINGSSYDGSDRRIKKDIKELDPEESKEFIMSLKPVTFEFDNSKKSYTSYREGKNHGFIAQDVKKIMDDLGDEWNLWFTTNEDGEDKSVPDNMEHLDYKQITADLVSVVQQQQKQIEALTKRIEALEGGAV